MAWPSFLNTNYASLKGRLLGLARGVITPGDSFLTGDQFHGPLFSVADSLVAHAGGTQAAALPLTAMLNRIITVGTAADSVRLPPSQPGMCVTVINDAGANSLTVYGAGTDTIDAVATATGNALAAGHRGEYVCVTAGKWQSYGGAKASSFE